MILIILCFVPRVFSEVSLQHHVYVSRKSRSNSEPFETGYVSSHSDDSSGVFSKFDAETGNRNYMYIPRSSKFSLPTATVGPYYTHSAHISVPIIGSSTVTRTSLPKRDLAIIEKSNSKYYSPGFLPSKLKTDAMYEHLKSAMHYKPPFDTDTRFGYENEYHIDDDDIRTSSRGLHDSWPYYYYNPYEYEHMRIDVEREKAKDKRYAVDAAKIIPIHEDLSDDIPYSQEPLLTTTEFYFTTTDNPMSGHDPFFSVMLNDYNKNYDYGDQLTLKGIDWNNGEVLDQEEVNRVRRLPFDKISKESDIDTNRHHRHHDFGSTVQSDSETKQGNENKHKFNKHEKSDNKKKNDRTKYHQNELKQTGFKDFVDNFANKFGSEDHKKDSKYIMKRNQDKGENRKGFRRVYHKDEYQEDNEFYDNNNSSAIAEDKGSSNAHIGGSKGLLKSTSYANLGNHASGYDQSGDTERNMFENDHNGHDNRNTHNTQFHKYRDVAKQAAYSNDTDYSIH